MWESWGLKRRKSRKRQKQEKGYSLGDILLEIVLWVPEIFLLPFRILYILGKIMLHAFRHVFDVL